MSDTLADLASWLPSEFLSGDMEDKPPFLNNHNPHRFPYDFASSSSTESESDEDDVPGLTRRFTRSVSLQERLKIPYPVEKKRVFSGSPESTLNWNVSGPTHVRSSPTTSFAQPDDDTLDLFYAAAGQVARMKMNSMNDVVFRNRGLLGAPRLVGPPLSHHNRSCAMLRSEKEVFIRQQQLREKALCAANCGGGRLVAGRPVGFGQSAWPPHPVETQRRQQPTVNFVSKLEPGGSSGGIPAVKKGCAGTGVFLPRNYSNVPPESKKTPVCSPANPPVIVPNKHLDHIFARPQANIHGVFPRQHQVPPLPHRHLKYDELAEMIMAHRQNAVMLAQQRRSSSHESVPEARMGQPEVVLPQEWTY